MEAHKITGIVARQDDRLNPVRQTYRQAAHTAHRGIGRTGYFAEEVHLAQQHTGVGAGHRGAASGEQKALVRRLSGSERSVETAVIAHEAQAGTPTL